MNRLNQISSCIDKNYNASKPLENNNFAFISNELKNIFSSKNIAAQLTDPLLKVENVQINQRKEFIKAIDNDLSNTLDLSSDTNYLLMKINFYNVPFSSLIILNVLFLREDANNFRPLVITNNLYLNYDLETNIFFILSIIISVLILIMIILFLYKSQNERDQEKEANKKKKDQIDSECNNDGKFYKCLKKIYYFIFEYISIPTSFHLSCKFI